MHIAWIDNYSHLLPMGGEGRPREAAWRYTAHPLTRRKNPLLEGVNMLTVQKRKFAVALMFGASKKNAAIEAGYSDKTARSKGSQLAKDPEVIAFIERKKKEEVDVDEASGCHKNVNTPNQNVNTPTVNTPRKKKVTDEPGDVTGYVDPIEYLKAVMNGVEPDDIGRRDAAKAMLPYMHPKKGEGGKKDAKNNAAKAAASKFGAMQPPKLVVSNKE